MRVSRSSSSTPGQQASTAKPLSAQGCFSLASLRAIQWRRYAAVPMKETEQLALPDLVVPYENAVRWRKLSLVIERRCECIHPHLQGETGEVSDSACSELTGWTPSLMATLIILLQFSEIMREG